MNILFINKVKIFMPVVWSYSSPPFIRLTTKPIMANNLFGTRVFLGVLESHMTTVQDDFGQKLSRSKCFQV